MREYTLTYVVNTYNKLPYLKEAMARLVDNVQPDEEIVVVDGASNDGTKEFLQQLLDEKKINRFVTEPDKGESHGWNKGLLLAKGELIKVITDDDVFYYPAIAKCREFMLSHPEIDLIGTSGAGTDWTKEDLFVPLGSHYESFFQKWMYNHTPFVFSGLGLMVRKSSLPLIGLFHTGMIWVDAEFSLRVTSGKANLAWYSGNNWVRILNEGSNTAKFNDRMSREMERLEFFYLDKPVVKTSRMKRFVTWALALPNLIRGKLGGSKADLSAYCASPQNPAEVFQKSESWLRRENDNRAGLFLYMGH